MRLGDDAATIAFRAELLDWLAEHPPPFDDMARDPARSTGDLPPWARRWQRSLFDAGWLVPGWPPELGGREASPSQQLVYLEELGRRGIPRTPNVQGLAIVAPSIVDFGSPEQVQEYALPLLRGEKSACLGMSEPGAGSDLAALTTRAERRGDSFVVNGQKVWTSGAQHADFCFCFVRTDPDAPKHAGISLLLVDLHETPGITIRPLAQLHGRERSDFNEVFFEDVVVPADHLVGEPNRGWMLANRSLGHERRLIWILDAVANQQRFDRVVALARSGDARGRRITGDPRVLDRLASLYVDTQALVLLGRRSVAKQERGLAAPEQSVLKLLASESARELELVVFEALGPYGLELLDEPPGVRPWATSSGAPSTDYFRAFVNTIAGGTSEIQRNIIGERVLGLPR